jgi:hypothetical protein
MSPSAKMNSEMVSSSMMFGRMNDSHERSLRIEAEEEVGEDATDHVS